jgi:hypothetical protein
MSLWNEALGVAADTQDIQAGGEGFLDKLGMAFSAGATAAAYSGLGSIYNTAASGLNAIGADIEHIDTYKKLQEIDDNWAQYYKDNQNAIDVVGFIGSSLIPGTLGIKGLNAVRAGMGGNAFGRALGFARTKQVEYLDKALVDLSTEGGTIFSRINTNKLAAMGWGVADQTLTAAAFETGVALTMKQSPLLADDSWWDITKTGLINAAFGGVIGGGIDSVILNRGFKDAVRALDTKQRAYDYQQVFEKFNLAAGDKSYGIIDSVLRLPDSVLESDKLLQVSFRVAAGTVDRKLDVGQYLLNSLKGAEKSAMLDFEKSLRIIGGSDNETAAGIANLVLTKYTTLKNAGAPTSNIRDQLGDLLFELKSVRPATEAPFVPSTDLWYFNKAVDTSKIADIESWKRELTSTAPFTKNAYSKPYQFLGTDADLKRAFDNAAVIGVGEGKYGTLAAAWKDGKHVALLPDGAVRVNDSSPLWHRIDDPVYNPVRYINTHTGAITPEAVLTAADRVPAGSSIATGVKADGVYLPVKEGGKLTNKFINMKTFNPEGDVEYFTARHAWAAKLEDKMLPDEIDASDFSLMDRLSSVTDASQLERITITSAGEELGLASELSLETVIKNSKLSAAQGLFADAYDAGITLDTREVAYKLNVEPLWLENAVASRFSNSLSGTSYISGKEITNLDGISRNLNDYLRRETVLGEFARPQQFTDLGLITPAMSAQEKRNIIMETVAANGGGFVTGELAWQYRVQRAVQVTKSAAASVLGTERHSQLLDLAQDAAKLADSVGVGASFLAASNSNYGEVLKLWAQNTGKSVHGWINEDLSKIVNAFATVASKLRADPAGSAELGIITNFLRSTEDKYIWDPLNPKRLMLRDLKGLADDNLFKGVAAAESAGKKAYINLESDNAAQFLKAHSDINGDRVQKRSVLVTARGMTSNFDHEVVYAPPIDTTYFKHFAFVRPKDGKAFGTSEVTMIFGRDAGELSKRMAMVDRDMYDVVTKDGTEKYFKAKELYDFDLTINEPRINSELKRSGALSNAFPEVRPENLMEDYMRWHQNQTARLVRDAVETNYAQQVAEIKKLGEGYVEAATSRFAGTLRSSKSEVVNPYDDYVKTALDISKRSEYTFFHQANEFVDALGTRAYQILQSTFGDASKGIVSWEEANRIAARHGIEGPYKSAEDFFASNTPRDRSLIKEYVSKANMLLANFVLRFDFANSLINIISTPLTLGTEYASIRNLASKDSELTGKLNELTRVKVPGTDVNKIVEMPTTTKLMFNAVKNFFGSDKEELLARYMANGDIKQQVLSEYHGFLDDLQMRADFKPFKEGVDRAFAKAGQLTLNNWAEQLTRFVSADVMRQLSDPLVEAGKLTLKEQNAYISTFVNRVQGNYVSSQRPIIFQGVLGSAVGLFQTYSFNLLQQLLRHVENGDKKAVATMFGMQAGLFGLNGTPMFEAINTHIIGNSSINQGHYDAYSVAPALVGPELGNWLMYGTASAFPAFGNKWPSLYTRGDINPRFATVIPIKPTDVPSIDASIRVVNNIADMGSKLIKGADISTTLLQGLEHNGVNRPLAGFAQVVAGQSTTSKGGLISAANEFSLVASAARIAGAKPFDESLALNAKFRNVAYEAADRDRIEHLGEAVKTYLYKNQMPPDEVMDGFMKDFTASGGRPETFSRSLQGWMKDANSSVIEKMRGKLQSSYGQRLNEIMGGEPLSDYRNQAGQSELQLPQ